MRNSFDRIFSSTQISGNLRIMVAIIEVTVFSPDVLE